MIPRGLRLAGIAAFGLMLGWNGNILAGEVLPAAGTVEVAFSPWDDAEGLVLRTLASAKQSIRVQAYVLTSRNIAAALQQAKERGLDVRLLADREQMERNDNSLVPQMAAAGVAVRLETRYSAAHNKVLILDADGPHPVVVTGSYNFSWSAQARNAENLLVLRDNPRLAKAYRDNWQRQWDEAEPFSATTSSSTNSTRPHRATRRDATVCALLSPEEKRLTSDCR
ncbi:MAG TPA: phospholipase D family protein [Rhodocyclaceae bacterium]|nr:phospholipase D family protein [Rhodocyclaceae bacterium]